MSHYGWFAAGALLGLLIASLISARRTRREVAAFDALCTLLDEAARIRETDTKDRHPAGRALKPERGPTHPK